MDTFDKIFDKEGLISLRKSDYVPRQSQIDAAYAMYDALIKNKHFILEGPCGFGKTFAYLVPVFEMHHNKKMKTVIVTDGISLQEQLVNKDIPIVNGIFRILYNRDITFALLKGKGNFICLRKYIKVRDGAVREKSSQMTEINLWMKSTATGDMSELSIKPDPLLHNKISCTQEGECENKHCNSYNDCFYQKHKFTAQSSNIIVTNYHLLFSDWKIGDNVLLPKYDVAVFDEAHEFHTKFREFGLRKFSSSTVKYLKSDIGELINEYTEINSKLSDNTLGLLGTSYDLASELLSESSGFMQWLYEEHFHDDKNSENALITGQTLFMRDPQKKRMTDLMFNISENLADIRMSLDLYYNDEDVDVIKYKNTLSRIINSMDAHSALLNECDGFEKNPKIVYWLDKCANYSNKVSIDQRVSICYKPIDIAHDISRSFLLKDDLSCIFTSATLSTNGNFDFIKAQTGLDLCSPGKVVEFVGESPFNLSKQQYWFIPSNAKSGKDRTFVESLSEQVKEIIVACRGGALCLFTSNANMNLVYGELAGSLEIEHGHRSLLQGQKPTNKLVAEFAEDVDSVLFATRTFFTGIDVPGYALRCLIIDKLPFPHQNDPVMTKINSVLGFNEMFNKYSVPMMIITLKQAVGRGVRSINDKCVISILDSRILTERSYNLVFKKTFPYNRGSQNIQGVVKFLFPETEDYL